MPSKPRRRANADEIAEGVSRGMTDFVGKIVTIALVLILVYVIAVGLLIFLM